MVLEKIETDLIIQACMNVHNELGNGFLEAVYQSALAIEFEEMGIPYKKEVKIEVYYKGKNTNQVYYADFICYDKIIVELKAASSIVKAHKAQVINYLKGTKLNVGYIINFGENSLKWDRLVRF